MMLIGIQEATKNQIDLPDDNPNALERMLTYLYASKYDDLDVSEEETPTKPNDPCEQNAEISDPPAAEDRDERSSQTSSGQGMWSIKAEAAELPVHVLVSAINNNVLVYALADKYDIDLLKELAHTKFQIRTADEWAVSEIVNVLQNVYTTTPTTDRRLRTVMLQVCLRYMEDLMQDETFRQLLHGDASLCFDVLSEVQRQNSERANNGITSIVINAREARLKRVMEWTKTQEQGFKHITLANSTCQNCVRPLDLSVSNGATTDWHGPFIVKCRHCRFKYLETVPG